MVRTQPILIFFHEIKMVSARYTLLGLTSGESRDVQSMNDELYECDWCGVLMDKPDYSSRRGSRHYCSYDCYNVKDLLGVILISFSGFSLSIFSLFISDSRKLLFLIFGAILGLSFSYCSFEAFKFRRKVPRGSRKGFLLEDGVYE